MKPQKNKKRLSAHRKMSYVFKVGVDRRTAKSSLRTQDKNNYEENAICHMRLDKLEPLHDFLLSIALVQASYGGEYTFTSTPWQTMGHV